MESGGIDLESNVPVYCGFIIDPYTCYILFCLYIFDNLINIVYVFNISMIYVFVMYLLYLCFCFALKCHVFQSSFIYLSVLNVNVIMLIPCLHLHYIEMKYVRIKQTK